MSIRDLQKINIHDFQTQQELPSSSQNKIINKKRKGQAADDGHEQDGETFVNNAKWTQSVQEEYLYNQNNNYDTRNGQSAPHDLKQLDNFMNDFTTPGGPPQP